MYLLYDAYQYNDGEKKKKRRFVMKAVVIGGKGHIGTYLCPMLVKNGFEVVSITRGNSQPYEDDYAWKDVESVFLDRNKCSNFEEQVISMNPDIIIDLVNFNIEDTKKMVEAIKKSNVSHYLYCSSCWAYGMAEILPFNKDDMNKVPLDEYNILLHYKYSAELYYSGF